MIESIDDYHARLARYVEGRDAMAMLREAPVVLAQLMKGVDEDVLSRRPSPRQWSVTAIVAHLAEDELVSSFLKG